MQLPNITQQIRGVDRMQTQLLSKNVSLCFVLIHIPLSLTPEGTWFKETRSALSNVWLMVQFLWPTCSQEPVCAEEIWSLPKILPYFGCCFLLESKQVSLGCFPKGPG